MGAGQSSSAIETTDVVGEVEQKEEESVIQVTYGPNIVGQLLGYDLRTEQLSQAAHQIFDVITRPSNQNKKKVEINKFCIS